MQQKKNAYALIAVVYLLGLFIGALDTGIVTPGRTVIQNDLGVDDQLGIWLITIYTLAYAAAIPLMGKMADRIGRKYVYLFCVTLFGIGSLGCGLAKTFDSFTFLLVARVVQAIGGGGIMPIATAEFGTAFPVEKRGMALGLTGGVYGIANVFGASAGSLILDIFGQSNWQFIFYINVPICLFIVVVGLFKLKNGGKATTKPLDVLGTLVLVVMVLSLLYGLRNLDIFDFAASLASADVAPFLATFVVLLPVFVLVERRAADPIINLSYFSNLNIVITLVLGMITGVIMMGVIFVPQFAENALFMPSGKGGYWVILLGIFAGVGSPMSGKLIDKIGVKPVLGGGFVASVAGALFLAFVAANHPSALTVAISFILIGLGMGFIMGTPVNYMMLENTDDAESNSAMATLSLMRSVGTAIAPAILVAFLAQSGALVQDRVMEVLPGEVSVPQLPYQAEVADQLDKYKTDPATSDMMAEADFPDLDSFNTVEFDMNAESGKYVVSDEVLELLKASDVTTIVDGAKAMASAMFAQVAPDQIGTIRGGIDEGVAQMRAAQADMASTQEEMRGAIDEMTAGMQGIDEGIAQQQSARSQLMGMVPMIEKVQNYRSVLDFIPASAQEAMPASVVEQLSQVKTADELRNMIESLQGAIAGMEGRVAALQSQIASLEEQLAAASDPAEVASLRAALGEANGKLAGMQKALSAQRDACDMLVAQLPTVEKMSSYASVLDLMPESVKAAIPGAVLDQLAQVKTTDDLYALIGNLDAATANMQQARAEMESACEGLRSGIEEISAARAEMDALIEKLAAMQEALPSAFSEAEDNYLAAIDEKSADIQKTFQMTLNEGFANLFTLIGACGVIGLLLLALYKSKSGHRMQKQEQ